MTYLVKLGVVVACVVAACSSSKDALFNDGGPWPQDAQSLGGAHRGYL